MRIAGTPALSPVARRLLFADAAFEGFVALALSGALGRAHWWLNVERPVTIIAACVFLAAAAILLGAGLSRATPQSVLRPLAFGNLAAGAAIWVGAVITWSRFEPEGRWLIGAIADGFLALGLLEYLAIRREAPEG
jgi:hypothetical protein